MSEAAAGVHWSGRRRVFRAEIFAASGAVSVDLSFIHKAAGTVDEICYPVGGAGTQLSSRGSTATG
jgi:hypothetical protein